MLHDFLNRLGIANPIIQGPMGGGPSTPELVAAVSNAGGLGSLGAAYLTPEQLRAAVRRIRVLTSRPFNVNLFAGGWPKEIHAEPGPMLDLLAEVHGQLGLPPPATPQLAPDPFPDQFEALMEDPPPVFSFTFGIPDREIMSRLKSRGIVTVGTATTLEEARLLAEAGCNAVVAQGSEAGAHRGTFAASFESSMVPTLELTRRIAGGLPGLPVIASGGLMEGAGIATAMRLGAAAAQLGTAFLVTPESGAPAIHKRAILDARTDTTAITRAFSGRPARGIVNRFVSALRGREEIILPYPLQNALTRPMRTEAAKQGRAEFLSLWAGQGLTRARELPAGKLVGILVEEAGL